MPVMDEEVKPKKADPVKDLNAIKLAIQALEKQFGPNTVIHGTAEFPEVDVIPTGNFELDLALGVGGLPRGKITEISGPEALGKTLIALNCAANAQKAGGLVAYIDVECDLNPDWATTLGVNVDELYISQPSSGEEALTIMEKLVKTGAFDLIVLDSVAAMATQAELNGDMEDAQVASLPRLMAKGMHKLRAPISESNTCAIFINQVRDKIGFMASGTTTPGGRALRHACAVRIELARAMGSNIKDKNGESVGTKVKAEIIKNKVGNPMKVVEYENRHGIGFDNYATLLKLGQRFGLISRAGAWYSYGDNKLGMGEDNAKTFIQENPDLEKELKDAITHIYKEKAKK